MPRKAFDLTRRRFGRLMVVERILKPTRTTLDRIDNDGPYAPGHCRRVEAAS